MSVNQPSVNKALSTIKHGFRNPHFLDGN